MATRPPDIRPLEPTDRPGWDEMWRGYQRFYKVEIPPETSDRTFARLLDPAEPMHALLAEDEGKVVGLVHFLFHRSTWTTGDYCYLQDLFVAEAGRGRGIGRKLIEAVVERARAQGASRVYWLTHETNAEAMILYDRVAQKSGFIQYRIVF